VQSGFEDELSRILAFVYSNPGELRFLLRAQMDFHETRVGSAKGAVNSPFRRSLPRESILH
jgi:hypothetical protein